MPRNYTVRKERHAREALCSGLREWENAHPAPREPAADKVLTRLREIAEAIELVNRPGFESAMKKARAFAEVADALGTPGELIDLMVDCAVIGDTKPPPKPESGPAPGWMTGLPSQIHRRRGRIDWGALRKAAIKYYEDDDARWAGAWPHGLHDARRLFLEQLRLLCRPKPPNNPDTAVVLWLALGVETSEERIKTRRRRERAIRRAADRAAANRAKAKGLG